MAIKVNYKFQVGDRVKITDPTAPEGYKDQVATIGVSYTEPGSYTGRLFAVYSCWINKDMRPLQVPEHGLEAA